jgi:hypothetical protein
VDGPECFYGEAKWAGSGELYEAPASTASLDAITALIERELPTRYLTMATGGGRAPHVVKLITPWADVTAIAATLILALCAAFARAMAAKRLTSQDQDDKGC